MTPRSALAATLTLVTAASSGCARRDEETQRRGPVLTMAPGEAPTGFARAMAPRAFTLPLDHGPHYDFQTEWWYYTGNLATNDGRRFGFQLTFFRRGLTPGPPPAGPGLASNQVYFAHFALTDVGARQHVFFERWSRGAAGLAGAAAEPFAVWIDDWRAQAPAGDGSALRLTARESGAGIDLDLRSMKPLVRHGDRGLSPKSEDPGNASYYVGYTRLEARGAVTVAGASIPVEGSAWFDHEWSTSALGPAAVGWDWWSLQLGDGRELMFFRIRRADGTIDPASGGTLVAADGTTRRILGNEVAVEAGDRWTSPESGATYPVKWSFRVPSLGLDLVVDRLVDAQEVRTSFTYWEGAVRVTGTNQGRPIDGYGYTEMTGYAGSMQRVF